MATLFLQKALQKNFQFISSYAKPSVAFSLHNKTRSQNVFPARKFHFSDQNYSKLFYTETHEWLKVDQNIGTIGITDFAQEQLGDIAYCDLPSSDTTLEKGECFATIESVKAASDLYMPVTAKIVEVNGALADKPSLINESPFDRGWIVKVQLADSSKADLGGLLDEKQYEEVKSSEE